MFSERLNNFTLSLYNSLVEKTWWLKLITIIVIAKASPVNLDEYLARNLTDSFESLSEDSKKRLTLALEELILILLHNMKY